MENLTDMAKDPAFLFYSKDWLEGTAEMTSEEKGIYIDLLAHQHQKGDLPADTKRLAKLAGMSESDFLPLWQDHLESKFEKIDKNRLVNRKLNRVVVERLDRASKNKVVSALAVVVKKCTRSYSDKFEAKKNFKVDDFLGLEEPILTERVTKWFTERLPFLEDVNVNEDVNANGNVNGKEKEGCGEKKENQSQPKEKKTEIPFNEINPGQTVLVPRMMAEWMVHNPDYPTRTEKDNPALQKIAKYICEKIFIPYNPMEKKCVSEVMLYWKELCEKIPTIPHINEYEISQVEKYIQTIIKKIQNGTGKQQPGTSTSRTAALKDW